MTALAPDALEALRKALGDDAVDATPAVACGDVGLAATLAPADEAGLAHGLAALAERRIGVVVQGGGSRAALGNPPRGARALLSTRRLAGVVELDAEEGVANVRAGTPLAELRAAVADAGLELPLDPPGAGATLGGTLAAAAIGPRHTGFGRPRDLVLGLDVVMGDGARARCGGRVVKNVTGYDLMKLHVGGHGAFGVIAAAWLRLRPRPEQVRTLAGPLPGADAAARALGAARLATARACALVDPRLAPAWAARGSEWGLVVELAGDESAVARDAARVASELGLADTDAGAVDRLRGLQDGADEAAALRFRVAVLPSRLGGLCAALRRAGAALLAHPASGLVYARFVLGSASDGAGVDRAWLAVRSAARPADGEILLEAAPPFAKLLRDAFGDARDALRLTRALKARFDPAGILNPGRFLGGL